MVVTLKVTSANERILFAQEEELNCKMCRKKIVEGDYYCERGKYLWCLACAYSKIPCPYTSREEHQEWKIDSIRIIFDAEKIAEKIREMM